MVTYRGPDGKTYSGLQVHAALKFGRWEAHARGEGILDVTVKETGEEFTLTREGGYWLAHCSAAGEAGERAFKTEAEADAYQTKHRETCPYPFGHVIEPSEPFPLWEGPSLHPEAAVNVAKWGHLPGSGEPNPWVVHETHEGPDGTRYVTSIRNRHTGEVRQVKPKPAPAEGSTEK